MKLHNDVVVELARSSSNGVALSMQRVSSALAGGEWLSVANRYRDRGSRRGNFRLREDLRTGNVHNDDLADYIGVSAPLHSLDGWALLGRAIHSLLRGDPYSGVHLAYYAELRAALALLATQGIGVFDSVHCVVDDQGDCTLVESLDDDGVRIGNHQWTWLVFQWWAEQARAAEMLGKVIQPGSDTLESWVTAMNKAQFALQQIGTDWLQLWGMDIGRYFADREARNLASYWPNTVNSWPARTAVEDYQVIADLWLSFEPSTATRFELLDRHLLRIVLRRGFFGASGHRTTSQSGKSGFKREVEAVVREMAFSGPVREWWKDFLEDEEALPPRIIRLAGKRTKVGKPGHVVEVMARAAMLLRVATGASAMLLADSGIDRSDVAEWIKSIGEGRGLWIAGSAPIDLMDLWRDIGDVIDDIESVVGNQGRGRQELWEKDGHGISLFGECERVALWGLGL